MVDLPLAAPIVVLVCLMIPILIAAYLFLGRPLTRTRAGALALTTAWNAVGLLVGSELAVEVGWWTYGEAGPHLGHTPVALWLGWVILWGPVSAQIPVRLPFILIGLAVVDFAVMPQISKAIQLGPNWIMGEVVLRTGVALPGLLLARWFGDRRRLAPTALLQIVLFAGLLFWVLPVLATSVVGRTLQLGVPVWALGVLLVVAGIVALPALVGVHDFYLNGATPWPWDETDGEVRSGPYRYVNSPMQLSGALSLVVAACIYGEPVVAAAVVPALLYARMFDEFQFAELSERLGPRWVELVLSQHRWIPSLRPSPLGEPAVVWVEDDSDSRLAEFLIRRSPVGLEIRSAADHPDQLSRLRYERAGGVSFDGVAGVGATLEHLHLGWAMVGWIVRVPGLVS